MPTTNVGKINNQGGLCVCARIDPADVGSAVVAVRNVTQEMNSGVALDQNPRALGFSELPKNVVANHKLPCLNIRDTVSLIQTSTKLCEEVREALTDAKKQVQDLEIILKQLITRSGITGIQIPEGPFNHSIHKLSVLTAFKDAFPNAIAVLNRNDITDINARYVDGDTPLLRANMNGFIEIAKVLIDLGADVNLADNVFQRTPLLIAAIKGLPEIVKALIDFGADVNLADINKWTPLHGAAYHGRIEIAQALIDAGADVSPRTLCDDTPLDYAAKCGHCEIARVLIDAGANESSSS